MQFFPCYLFHTSQPRHKGHICGQRVNTSLEWIHEEQCLAIAPDAGAAESITSREVQRACLSELHPASTVTLFRPSNKL